MEKVEEIREMLKKGPVIVLLKDSDSGEAVEIKTEEELKQIALLL